MSVTAGLGLGKAEELFFELSSLPAAERRERLSSWRAIDPTLAEQVAALLEANDRAEGFLQSGELHDESALDETLPVQSRIADYTILGVLGTGGMGMVYVAQQERPRRTVALKLIRRGLAVRSVLRRFEHEAEVLGRLQHPGIAQIYEAGVADYGFGPQPFIAMELVSGGTLAEFARRRNLDRRGRLAIVAEICDAVAHAHQRGVIHRDLKPANILVDESTGENGRPKVLDFGIARVTEADLAVNTLLTGQGQLMGTLPYMSPEQFDGDAGEVDTRADVYALGVILHELLSGQLPLDLRGKTIAEAALIVRDREPQRLGAIDRELRGDVETIVLKALEKDKRRRYQSAAELGADIRRCLAGEPIEAKRDSSMYVLRKQLARHRVAAAAVGAAILALVAFAVVVSVQLQRNRALAGAEKAAKNEALISLDAARIAQKKADDTAQRLRAELAASSLEHGRLLGRAGNFAAAEDIIWPELLRDPDSPYAYWGLWELYWRHPCAASIRAHPSRITATIILPGAETFATASLAGEVTIWDRRTVEPLRTFRGTPGSELIQLAASPTRPHLAAGHRDGSIIVWDIRTGETVRTFTTAPQVRALVYSHDGDWLVTGAQDGVIRFWPAAGDGPVRELPALPRPIARICLAPDGTIVSTVIDNEVPYLLRPGAAEPIALPRHDGVIWGAAVSPDGRTFATSANDRLIRIWDMATLEQRSVFGGRNGTLNTMRFSQDGSTLLTSGYWAAETWDVASGKRTLSLPSHMAVLQAAISPDGRWALAGSEDGLVRVWQIGHDAGVTRLGPHRGRVAAEASPDGRLVATGDEEGKVRLWDAADGSLLGEFAGHTRRVRTIQFHPDGRLLATIGDDRVLRITDLTTGRAVLTQDGCDGVSAWSCAFSSDGSKLACVLASGDVAILDMPGGSRAATIPGTGANRQVVSVRFMPGDHAIVSIDRSFNIRVSGVDGSPLEPFERPEIQPWTVSFTADGRTMVAGSWARTVEVWDVASRKRVAELRGHSALIARVEMSPSASGVAVSAGNDGTLRLWDIPSRRSLASIDLFDGWDVTTASWIPGGRRILAAGADGTAVIIDPGEVERFIAGNAEYQIARLRARGEEFAGSARVSEWATRVRSGAGDPPPAPAGPGVDPAAVRGWAHPAD